MSDQTWVWFLYSRETASTSFFLFFSITNIIKQQILAGNLHAGSQPGIEKIWSWQSLMIATWWLSHHNLMQLEASWLAAKHPLFCPCKLLSGCYKSSQIHVCMESHLQLHFSSLCDLHIIYH
jgi:hypothetical protein